MKSSREPNMNTAFRFFIALSFLSFPATMPAQRPSPEQRPDLSGKALLTKATPDAKSTASPKPAKAVKQYTIEQFMNTTRVGGSAFTADEKTVLFHSNKSGIFNVYSIPVAGGEPKQLTNSTKESTYVATAFPTDARFLYRHDAGGNENEHLYLRELDGSERDLTPGEKTKANFLGWSKDQKSFFISTNERDPKFFDIFELSIADLKPQLIYQDESGSTSPIFPATNGSSPSANRAGRPRTFISTTVRSRK